ncbi:phenol hydroxylase subunit [Pseudomonas sp.]|uniref:phenol hydroxylase subunit n=1 Tax=Pseudomonas sp. TaxID=306 RepID=UPI00299D0FA3|nr:phenol hydroxylase subunit [Pseudomonas sp.]MDX1369194.1 phenol hydroxylase subunit [Pseudomonas sp.]
MNTLEPRFEDLPRYIRVRSEPGARFVEFDFAIGYPDLFVELVLPQAAFTQFCQHNRVVVMDQAMAQAVDDDMVKWRFGEAGSRMPGKRD